MSQKSSIHGLLEPGEEVRLRVHVHWFSKFMIRLQAILFAFGVPGALCVIFGFISIPISFSPALGLILTSYFLFIWWWYFLRILKKEHSALLVTNRRLIRVRQINMLLCSVEEVNLKEMDEIKGIIQGLMGTLMNFGLLQVSVLDDKITIEHVHDPEQIAQTILEIKRECEAGGARDPVQRRRMDGVRRTVETIRATERGALGEMLTLIQK